MARSDKRIRLVSDVKSELKTAQGKKAFNELHFSKAASRYDIGTKLLSLGLDPLWKRALVNSLPEMAKPVCLDLACGTGDVAFLLAKRYPQGEILGIDLTPRMLEVATTRNVYRNVAFKQEDIGNLSARNESIDIITGSYALRNAPNLSEALNGIHRALKPGGVAAFLDFSKPANKFLQQCQYGLLKFWGSFWGIILHADSQVHGYISASLPGYLDSPALIELFEKTGFEKLKQQRFLWGMMELIVVRKAVSEK